MQHLMHGVHKMLPVPNDILEMVQDSCNKVHLNYVKCIV